MSLRAEVAVLRRSVALSERTEVTPLRVGGGGAPDLLARLLPCHLPGRDLQSRLTLLLDDEARPIADVTVVRDRDSFVLLVDGPPPQDVVALLGPIPADVTVTPLHDSHALLALDGPFAWELLAAWDRPGVIGLPYLASYRPEPVTLCLRCGRCGEFGYELLVSRAEAAGVRDRLLELGAPLDIGLVGPAARAYCGLENHYFDPRREGRSGLTAIELQLQWRLDRRAGFRGADALARQRERGPERRVAGVRCPVELPDGAPIEFEGRPIGRVLAGATSLHGPGWFGLAALGTAWSYSGIDRYSAPGPDGDVPVRTVSPPFVVNESLRVDPRKHDYETWRRERG